MPVLYHFPLSPASRFIRLQLLEYKWDVELRQKVPWEYDEGLLRLNPAGELPVLDDAARGVYCGATVISEWLEETHDGASCWQARRQSARKSAGSFHGLIVNLPKRSLAPLLAERVTKRFQKGQAVSSDIIRTAIANNHIHFGYFDWLLGQHDWFAGDKMTLADLNAAAHLSVLDYFGDVSWDKYPDVKSWYMKMKSRPSFRPLLQTGLIGMAPASHYAELDF